MAAPPSATINNLTGTWVMNKSLSDSIEPALVIQGISWLTRTALSLATVTLETKQFTALPKPIADDDDDDDKGDKKKSNPIDTMATAVPVTHIEIQQIATGGIKGTREGRCLDGRFREHTDWLFGHVRGRSRFVSLDEVDDPFLADGWALDDKEEGAGGALVNQKHVLSHVENLDPAGGWTATQVWGFMEVDGGRRYVRKVVVAKGEKRAEFRLVYDWYEK